MVTVLLVIAGVYAVGCIAHLVLGAESSWCVWCNTTSRAGWRRLLYRSHLRISARDRLIFEAGYKAGIGARGDGEKK